MHTQSPYFSWPAKQLPQKTIIKIKRIANKQLGDFSSIGLLIMPATHFFKSDQHKQ
jgi:hypothetical protein